MKPLDADNLNRNAPKESHGEKTTTKTQLTISVLASLALIVSFIIPPSNLPGFSVCIFKNMSGQPCFGCGLTHGFCAISHGMFASAWQYNPFSFVMYSLFLLAACFPLIQRKFPRLAAKIAQPITITIGLVSIFALMTIFGLCRIFIG